jgi:hypothetical protein
MKLGDRGDERDSGITAHVPTARCAQARRARRRMLRLTQAEQLDHDAILAARFEPYAVSALRSAAVMRSAVFSMSVPRAVSGGVSC